MNGLHTRLKRIQETLLTSGLDAYLFVPGYDGCHNVGSSQAVSYTLLGNSGHTMLAGTGVSTETYDDSILLVTASEARLCLPSQQLAASVKNSLCQGVIPIQIYAPTESESSDQDALEELKLGAFVQMVRDVSTIGVAYGDDQAGNADVQPLTTSTMMKLEKWPLVMAYGLEGVGRPGFFTQNFKVYDVRNLLSKTVYSTFDSLALKDCLTHGVANLNRQWQEMITAVSSHAATSLASLTEKQIIEPLESFWQYGLMKTLPGNMTYSQQMPPRALFGLRSNEDSKALSDSATLTSSAMKGQGCATHCTIEAGDPHTGLRVGRTYFFSQVNSTQDLFADPDEEVDEDSADKMQQAAARKPSDAVTVVLLRVYSAVTEAVAAGINHFATQDGATESSVKQVVMDALVSKCALFGAPQPYLTQQVEMDMWQTDTSGQLTRPAVRGSLSLKVLRVTLRDVLAPGVPDSLGAVTYTDTFMEAVDSTSSRVLNLTSAIPNTVSWPGAPIEALQQVQAMNSFKKALADPAIAKGAVATSATARAHRRRSREQGKALATLARMAQARASSDGAAAGDQSSSGGAPDDDHDVEQDQDEPGSEDGSSSSDIVLGAHWPHGPASPLGTLLTIGGGDNVVLLTGAAAAPTVSGSLYCFSHGLAFIAHSTRSIWFMDFRRQLESIVIQDLCGPNPATSAGEAVVLRGQLPVCGLSPACNMTPNKHLAISLLSMAQDARRLMMSVVLPAWQQTCREGVPGEGDPTGLSLPIAYLKDSTAANPFPAACAEAHTIAVQAQHEGGKQWLDVQQPDADVDHVISHLDEALIKSVSKPDPAVEAMLLATPRPDSVAVSLVIGLPGADQALVSKALVDMMSDGDMPRIACLAADAGSADWSVALESGVANSLSRQLIITVSSFSPLVTILRQLADQPHIMQQRCHVARIVGVVTPHCMWEDCSRAAVLPGLVSQLPAGFLDALVVNATTLDQFKQVQATLQPVLTSTQVPVVRGGSLATLIRARDELLPDAEERMAALRSAPHATSRAMAYSAVSRIHQGIRALPAALPGRMWCMSLAYTGALDIELLRRSLGSVSRCPDTIPLTDAGQAKSTSASTITPQAPLNIAGTKSMSNACGSLAAAQVNVLGLSGVARTVLGGLPQDVSWGCAAQQQQQQQGCGYVWSLKTGTSAVHENKPVYGCPSFLNSDVACGGQLMVWGTGPCPAPAVLSTALLAPAGAVQAEADAQAAIPISPASLSQADKDVIAEAHKADALPDGWTWDGFRYYDEFGDSTTTHPLLHHILEEHCRQRNAAASQRPAVSVLPLNVTAATTWFLTG